MPGLIYCWLLLTVMITQGLVGGRANWMDGAQQPQQVAVIAPSVASNSPGWNDLYDPIACPCCTDWCEFQAAGGVLSCRDVTGWPDYTPECARAVESLDVIRGRFESSAGLAIFQNVRRISIRESHLEFLPKLPVPDKLVQLDLSHNELVYVNWTIFQGMPRLTHLNLAGNRLSFIQTLNRTLLPSLISLDLSGNEWECSADFRWALELHEAGILANGDNLTCQDESKKHDSWFKWNYSIIKREINKRIVDAECRERTAGCDCGFASEGKEGRVSYTVQVDCSHRKLKELPASLPSFTKELDVSGNLLTSLDQVAKYGGQSLKILIADSNHIHSIRNLSGSVFMRNFSRLSLQHNFISPREIPLKELSEMPSEFQIKYVYLYNNSWECDCHTATLVREWLWDNRHIVNDSSLILCSRSGQKIPVLHLLPSVVCPNWDDGQSKIEAQEYRILVLYSLIAVEVVLILVVVLKFTYDSWRYVRHGELPWMATKLF